MLDFAFVKIRSPLKGKTVLVPWLLALCFGVMAPIFVYANLACWNLSSRANPADVFDPENPIPYFEANKILPLAPSSPLRIEIDRVLSSEAPELVRVFRIPNTPNLAWIIVSNEKVYLTTDSSNVRLGQIFALTSPEARHLARNLETRLIPVRVGVLENRHFFQVVNYDKVKRLFVLLSLKYKAITDAYVAWRAYDKQPHARLEYDLLDVEMSLTDDDQIVLSTPIKENWRLLLKLRGTPFKHILGVQSEGNPTTPILAYANAMARYLIPIAESFFGLNGKAHDISAHIRGFLRMPKSSWTWFATTFQLLLKKYESNGVSEIQRQEILEKMKFVVDLADQASAHAQTVSFFKMSQLAFESGFDFLLGGLYDFLDSNEMVPFFLTPQEFDRMNLADIKIQCEELFAFKEEKRSDERLETALRNREMAYKELEEGHQYLLQRLREQKSSDKQSAQ